MVAMSKSDVFIVWSRANGQVHVAAKCGPCNGLGRLFEASVEVDDCEHCGGCGWFGINPELPVLADPGSVERIAMLSVRYATGTPLWNPGDRPVDEKTARFFEMHLADRNGRENAAHSEFGGFSLVP